MARKDKDGFKHNKKNNFKESRKLSIYSQKSVRIKAELIKKNIDENTKSGNSKKESK